MLDLLRFNFMKNSVPAQAVSQHQIMLDGVSVSYTLKRSPRRRSITLTVDENGLRVGAPWRSPETRIASMLEGHAHWITRKLAAWQARKPLPFTWETGAAIMVLGQPLTLLPAPARSNTTSDGVHLHVAAQADQPVMMAKQATLWLRSTALEWFGQRTAHFAPMLDVGVPDIRLSNARTRWGSCHPAGRVHFNWRLIHMPAPLIDYVVVHELAHLRVANHSPRFWHCVEQVLPDHKMRRTTLRLEGHRYLGAWGAIQTDVTEARSPDVTKWHPGVVPGLER